MSDVTPIAPAPCRLSAKHGIHWFFEPWRAVREKPLLWLILSLAVGLGVAAFFVAAAFFLPSLLPALGSLPLETATAMWAAWQFTARDASARPSWRALVPGALRAVLRLALIYGATGLLVWHFMGRPAFVLLPVAVLALAHCLVELARHLAGNAASASERLVFQRVNRRAPALSLLLATLLCAVLLPMWCIETGLGAALENAALLIFGFDPDFWERIPILPALTDKDASLLPLALGLLELATCLALTLWALLAQALAALCALPFFASLAHAARAMRCNWRACAVHICTLTLFCAFLAVAVLLAWRGIFIVATPAAAAMNIYPLAYVLLPLMAASALLALAAFSHEMMLASWLMARDIFGATAMQPVPETPQEAAIQNMALPRPKTLPSAAWREHPAYVSAAHGLRWLYETWRLIFQKPLLWLPLGLVMTVMGAFWLIVFLHGTERPLLALGILPGFANVVAIFMQSVVDGPADKFIGPPLPTEMLRQRIARNTPVAIVFNIVIYGGASWFLWRAELIFAILPVMCVLVLQAFDSYCQRNGLHHNADAVILSIRVWLHSWASGLMLLTILAVIVYFSKLPQHWAAGFAVLTSCLALAAWTLLAQALAALLNLPLGTALKRAADAMRRSAGACALYLFALSGIAHATTATIASLTWDIQGSLLLPGAALPLCASIFSILLPPWLMARDMFGDKYSNPTLSENP
ncbi:MAG: hypothetical protein IJR28_02975 [Ottowia sp.]|nr:hypothetical protein [Ottowia sp.]